MNFFQAQDQAKKKTKYLILVYILVLLVLTVLSSLVLLFLVPITIGQPIPALTVESIISPQHLPMFMGVAAFVIGGALISSYLKSRHLSQGGGVIAGSLGGVKISPNTTDFSERKVLNVVEEMAIASGMPVPEVYLLKQESAINAFAAGQTPMDAVIGVTKGCIDKLTRTQLQGVIGHEFSHILNGDMRLNLRIIMLLHGIEFIGLLGRILTSSQRRSRYSSRSRRSKGNGVIVLAGIALRIIGWFGVLFGNLIQAAVSRQREFLADASAVQFTRDPSSIAGALKVIGYRSQGSRIKNADVNEVAHMFFGQSFITRFSSLFATHPPVDERIKSIEPLWDGEFLAPLPPPVRSQDSASSDQNSQAIGTGGAVANIPEPLAILMMAGVMLDEMNVQQKGELNSLIEATSDPMEAMALIMAIFILGETNHQAKLSDAKDGTQNSESDWKALFLNSDSQEVIKGLTSLVVKQMAVMQKLDAQHQRPILLPLVELAMPALKEMSKAQYQEFKMLLQKVVLWDGHKSVFEQSLTHLLTRYLDVFFGVTQRQKVKFRKANSVFLELQLLFSCLVDYGHSHDSLSEITKQNAYKKAMLHLGFREQKLLDLKSIAKDSEQIEVLFNRAVEKLLFCSQDLKQQIVEAINIAIEFDGEVNQIETELALAIAATMDAPLPRVKL